MLKRRKQRNIYSTLSKKTKNFLLSKQSREFFVFLFFFFIASAFWLLQTLNDDYEAEFSIPVRLKDIPNDVVITTEAPSVLKIKVKDKGSTLLNYAVAKKFYPINLDFPDYTGNNNHIRIYASEFEKSILSQLNISTRLLSVYPDTLEYIYATGKAKRVPIKLQGKITSGRQYYIPDTLYSPDSILVYAPSSLLDTIKHAYTERIILENISDTTTRSVNILPVKGAKFIPDVIDLMLPVDIYTEKTVEVPLQGIGFPADKVLRTFPSKVQVTFQVGMRNFKNIAPEDFAIEIPYEEFMRTDSDKYKVKLSIAPSEVSHIRISPEQIDFLIEQVTPHAD